MKKLTVLNLTYDYCDISDFPDIEKYPYSLRMLLESVLRQEMAYPLRRNMQKSFKLILKVKRAPKQFFSQFNQS